MSTDLTSSKLKNAKSVLAQLPSVDRVLNAPASRELLAEHGRPEVTRVVRHILAELRDELRAVKEMATPRVAVTVDKVLARVSEQLTREAAGSLVEVFNLTGTVLHTNLGRAALPAEAIVAIAAVARGPSNLEFDLESGNRGDRDTHVEDRICAITGAEAATVVNNNAAAVMLVLNTLALGKEVPVSRGELVEIGGSFRIPDIMSRSGCKLVEVGTTNRTHLKDFAHAIGQDTALIMKVHTSNYVIEGFTKAVSEADLAELCRRHCIPFVNDLGSGTLVDLERYGLPHEPTPMDALRSGADLVTFSGDKMLGGPQAGVIVGQADLIGAIKSNPMKRAMRCDKMTLAALSSVLQLYANPDTLQERLPTLHALTRPESEIRAAAERVRSSVDAALRLAGDVAVCSCDSQIGSGALPTRTIESAGLRISPRAAISETAILDAFRALPRPVIGRIKDGAVVLDLRCLMDEQAFVDQLAALKVEA
ncbi:MAG: L-seryl-tRNA(Sec) selenium transferase [Pseudomonadota bacterium]